MQQIRVRGLSTDIFPCAQMAHPDFSVAGPTDLATTVRKGRAKR